MLLVRLLCGRYCFIDRSKFGRSKRLLVMRRARRLVLSVFLALGSVLPAVAIEPDDLPWDEIDRVLKEQPAAIEPDAGSTGPGPETDDLEKPSPGARDEPDSAALPAAPATSPQQPPAQAAIAPAIPPAVPAQPATRLEPSQAIVAPAQAMTATNPTSPNTPTAPAAAASPPVQPPATVQPPIPVMAPAEPMAPPPQAVPSSPVTRATMAVDGIFYLPMKRYFETRAAVALKEFTEPDRTALAAFYTQRMGAALWVTKDGFTPAAQDLISEIKKADDWGLSAADYKIPGLTKIGTGEFQEDDLSEGEIKLSLVAMEYARHARGDRISEPSTQLSSYIDRKPQLYDRQKLLENLAASASKSEYLRSLHPKHTQFVRLREKLLALRGNTNAEEIEDVPDGPKITPGKSNWQVALVRKRLKVTSPGLKPDGTAGDENYYDDVLARAVERYKEANDLEPVNATITTPLRKALNKKSRVNEATLIANMEQWRWMPDDLGAFHIDVNIPEFVVRVVKNGKIIHEERIVTGRYETQTPIFSDSMRTIVFQPAWNVPESIKVNELLPKLRDGGNPIERQGLLMQRNGRDIDPWDVDWSRQDIRQYHIYQPPGDANVLGIVKFLFPNKHSVYLHDTPSKRLFNEKVRMFSHGCMRVRNPVRLAEVIVAEDKGWDKEKVEELIGPGPENNDVALDNQIPVHVTYFTASVTDSGEIKTFADIYGHEQRIKLGIDGRWDEIVKNRDHLLPAEDVPVARNPDDWGDSDGAAPVRRARAPRYTYREPPPLPPQRYRRPSNSGTFGEFLSKALGGY